MAGWQLPGGKSANWEGTPHGEMETELESQSQLPLELELPQGAIASVTFQRERERAGGWDAMHRGRNKFRDQMSPFQSIYIPTSTRTTLP